MHGEKEQAFAGMRRILPRAATESRPMIQIDAIAVQPRLSSTAGVNDNALQAGRKVTTPGGDRVSGVKELSPVIDGDLVVRRAAAAMPVLHEGRYRNASRSPLRKSAQGLSSACALGR